MSTETGIDDYCGWTDADAARVQRHLEVKIVSIRELGRPFPQSRVESLDPWVTATPGHWNGYEYCRGDRRGLLDYTGDLAVMDDEGYDIVGGLDQGHGDPVEAPPAGGRGVLFGPPRRGRRRGDRGPDERFGEELMAWSAVPGSASIVNWFGSGKIADYKIRRYVKIVELTS